MCSRASLTKSAADQLMPIVGISINGKVGANAQPDYKGEAGKLCAE